MLLIPAFFHESKIYVSLNRWQREHMPSHFGPYQVVELLCVGGIGEVYKVHHSFLKKEFALKVIKSDRELDQHAVARFKKRIEVLGRLDHPGIVAARNADEQNGLLYLVMDLVKGRPLSEIVLDAKRQSTMLPIAQVCSWIGQAAEAIAYSSCQWSPPSRY
ncbi:MAG: protein kinase [Pirellulaceae bacterium]